jgi:geranylgeranylglycerol-phosphate geranylgeranyltransferase
VTAPDHLTLRIPVRSGGTVPLPRRLADLVVLVRLPSCLAGGASVLLGAHLAGSEAGLPARRACLGVLSILFAVAAANAVNDVLDVSADILAKPNRPLPAGRLTARAAWTISASTGLAAVILAAPLGGYAVPWVIVLLTVAFLYSYRAKNTMLLGNAVVALCASSPVFFGALIAGRVAAVIWIGAGISFMFMLTYETLKTIADLDTDAASGIRTFASRVGLRPAVLLLRGLVTLLTLAAATAAVSCPHPVVYLLALLVTFALPAWSAIVVLGRLPGRKAIRSAVLLMRLAWFLGIVALWLLR